MASETEVILAWLAGAQVLPERVGLEAGPLSPSGARVPVEASAGLEIQDGSRLNLVTPQIKLNGQSLPAFLLAGTVERCRADGFSVRQATPNLKQVTPHGGH